MPPAIASPRKPRWPGLSPRRPTAPDPQNLVEILARYAQSPVAFAEEVLGIALDPWQCDVLETLQQEESVAIRSSHGVGKCESARQDVLLTDGSYRKAGDLIGQQFEVLAFHPDGHMKPAAATATDNGVHEVIRVRTAYGRELLRTPEHPLRTWNGWREVKALRPGDRVLMPLRLPVQGATPLATAEIVFLAYMIADGSLSSGNCAFSKKTLGPVLDEWKEAVVGLGDRWNGPTENYVFRVTGGHGRACLHSHGLLGKRAAGKFVPAALFTAPNAQIAVFLNRLFACDGYACARWTGRRAIAGGEVGYSSMSRQLVVDVQRLLLRLGIVAAVRSRTAMWTHAGVRKRKIGWTVVVVDRDAIEAFADRVGILGKEAALAEAVTAARASAESGRGMTRGADIWPPETRAYLIDRARRMGILCYEIRSETGVYLDRGRPMPLRVDGVRRAASYLGDLWLTDLANGDWGWDTVTHVETLPPEPTVAISVPGPETYIVDLVEHNTTTLAVGSLHFLTTRPSPKVPMTAPTFNKQVRDILWAEIHKWWRPVAGRWPWFYDQFQLNQTRMQHVRMPNEWFAVGIASAKAVNLEGYHTDHVMAVFDEAKGIMAPTWQAVYGMRTTQQAKLFVASTPGGPTGEFHRVFTKLRTTWRSTFVVHPAVVRDHPDVRRDMAVYPEAVGRHPETGQPVTGRYARSGTYFSTRPRTEWVTLCEEEWGADSPVFIARVLGNFPEMAGDNLVPYAWLARAEDMEQGIAGRRVVACDPARYGRDRTTFLVLDGGTALHGETIGRTVGESTSPEVQSVGTGDDPKRPLYRATVVTADICARLRRQFDCETIVIDETGLGGGIADDLKRRGESVVPVNFGASPTDKPQTPEDRQYRERRHLGDTAYRNLKAELGKLLRDGFERAEIALANLPRAFVEQLIGQTSLVKVDFDAKGHMFLIDPDEQDEYAEAAGNVEGKKSPDHFHALLLGWWVASPAYRRQIPQGGRVMPRGISTLGEPVTQIGQITAPGGRGKVGGQAASIEQWHLIRRR